MPVITPGEHSIPRRREHHCKEDPASSKGIGPVEWHIEHIGADVGNTKCRIREGCEKRNRRKRLSIQRSNGSKQCRRCMEAECFKTVLLCPAGTLPPSRKTIKHGAKISQILHFELCAEASEVEQSDADQHRGESKHHRPDIRRGTGNHLLRQIVHEHSHCSFFEG